MELGKQYFILFLFLFTFNNICFGDEIDTKNVNFATFVNDCNYKIPECNLTIYSNNLKNNSFSKPLFFLQYNVSKQIQDINCPITFFGIFWDINIYTPVYKLPRFHPITGGITDQGFDDYQLLKIEYDPYFNDHDVYQHLNLPKLYHCKVYKVYINTDFYVCLTIDENNNFLVIRPDMWVNSQYLIQNTTNSINSTNLGEVNVGMNKLECIEYAHGDVNECIDHIIKLIDLKQIKTPILNYTDIVEIIGFNDTILICGNHPSNNSLIVYNYNITSEQYQFVFSNQMKLTHVIRHQYTPTQLCLFFSDISNSTILYDIFNYNIILKNDKLNLNISEYQEQGNERSIHYFTHFANMEEMIPPIKRPGYFGQPLPTPPTPTPTYSIPLPNNSNSIYQLTSVLFILFLSIFISILF